MIKAEHIVNKQFSRAFLGYDVGEVDSFLDDIVRDYERKEQELEVAQLRIKMLLEELSHYTGAPAEAEGEPAAEAEPIAEDCAQAPASEAVAPEEEPTAPAPEPLLRGARAEDIDGITTVETESFPPAEAATRERFAERLQAFPAHFWVLEEDGKIVGIINGMVTDRRTIDDVMFEDASLHDENGAWQSVMGLAVLPEFRAKGYAARLMEALIADAKAAGRKGCTLTCKERLVHYYAKFGYKDEGVSASTHGGAVWHDMVLTFDEK